LPELGYLKPVRVCRDCFSHPTDERAMAKAKKKRDAAQERDYAQSRAITTA